MATEQSIHQRVAERLDQELFLWPNEDKTHRKIAADILAEEYGPLIEAAKHACLLYDDLAEREGSQADRDAAKALEAELSKKGMI